MGSFVASTMGLSAEVLEAFQFFDKDDNKYLEWAVFEKMVQSLGETPTKGKLKEIWDANCPDGKADEAKVEAMWPAIQKEKKEKELSPPDCKDTDGKPAIDWKKFLDWMMP